jgi:protocatechuate 3,4-dioxygenase beta subunit
MTSFAWVWLALALFQVADKVASADARRGTCEIHGRVTDRESGLPMARAVVFLSIEGGQSNQSTRTDENGRYEFTALTAGTYRGSVQAGEFRATHLIEVLRGEDGRSAIVLKDGEVRKDVNVALPRGLALTVRVIDEWGEPLSGIRVTLTRADTGRSNNSHWMRATDDRGMLRLYRLEPGRYIVCAERNQLSLASSADSSRRETVLRTCYPSAASEAQAEPVLLNRADVEGLEIRMRRGRTFRISGTVVDASGTPSSLVMLNLNQYERGASFGRGVPVGADGRFTIAGIQPGDYALKASLGGKDRPEHRRDQEVAYQTVRVESSDVDGVVLALTRTVNVAGRVVFEDQAQQLPKPRGPGLFVQARLAGDQLPGSGSAISSYPGDGAFTIEGVFGRRTLEVFNVPPGWFVKSIRYKDKEIIDVPTEFKAGTDPMELEIILSTRGATVVGRVVDDSGNPAKGVRVVLVPVNPARRNSYEPFSAAVAANGEFRLGPQRGGDYFILALPAGSIPVASDTDRMAQLAESAERITLGDEEQLTLDLRVVRPR